VQRGLVPAFASVTAARGIVEARQQVTKMPRVAVSLIRGRVAAGPGLSVDFRQAAIQAGRLGHQQRAFALPATSPRQAICPP
jgi:hypothetical protein